MADTTDPRAIEYGDHDVEFLWILARRA